MFIYDNFSVIWIFNNSLSVHCIFKYIALQKIRSKSNTPKLSKNVKIINLNVLNTYIITADNFSKKPSSLECIPSASN